MPYSATNPRRANDVANLAPSAANRIADQRHGQSHTDARTVDRGDDGLAHGHQLVRMPSADELADIGASGGVNGGIADRGEIAHVRACAEGTAAAGHHDGPDVGIGLRVVETRDRKSVV